MGGGVIGLVFVRRRRISSVFALKWRGRRKGHFDQAICFYTNTCIIRALT
jgi:hypothetical protein